MSDNRRYDLAIIGGGTAGLVAAHGAAGVGARVVLVERREETGGDCLWTGCVPSKSLIASADLAHRMRTADRVGLAPIEPEIGFARVMRHVHDARRRIAPADSVARLRAHGVDVVHGEARFEGPGRLVAGGRALRFRTALIATGSRPAPSPVAAVEGHRPLTTETLWHELRALPARLVVLGGGPVGCELGQAFARLGSRVTMVEAGDRLLHREEPEAGDLVAARLAAEGVDVRLGATALRVERGAGGLGLVVAAADGGETRIPFDELLLAHGRLPNTSGLGLDGAGVETDEGGAVRVDRRLRTTAAGIFAAGDVTGGPPFTHVAGTQGRIVVANALFHARGLFDVRAVPWVTFTDPEVGRVGLTEAQSRARFGDRTGVARFDYDDLDRAITAGVAYGFAKLVTGPRGRLVGATVAASGGGEAIDALAARIAAGGTIADVSRQVHAYPTLAEGAARAADDHLRARWLTPGVRRITRPVLAILRAIERG